MRAIYSILIYLTWPLLRFIAHFNPKLKLFVEGRKKSFEILHRCLDPKNRVVWVHAASLGEYEQGLPIIQGIKQAHPNHSVLLTFFSPSGYEVKKSKTPADIVVYLPLDTGINAKKFLELAKPELAIFIKYEIWPNYLTELKKRDVPTLLVSAVFSKKQWFFKWYGGFMRNALKTFTHFFVQESDSQTLLNTIGITNTTISGDTRFDRVSQILQQDNSLDFMEKFKGKNKCFIAGSTWPEDEAVLVPYINSNKRKIKWAIAPHNCKPGHITGLKNKISKKVLLYSEIEKGNLDQAEVLIIDTIGLLTKIYSYADFAYVGGGFATGLHNTLEPAVFGIPVMIGPNYSGFVEATELVGKGGILVVNGSDNFATTIEELCSNDEFYRSVGQVNGSYIRQKIGATTKVLDYIKELL